jgi:hypothetical protein
MRTLDPWLPWPRTNSRDEPNQTSGGPFVGLARDDGRPGLAEGRQAKPNKTSRSPCEAIRAGTYRQTVLCTYVHPIPT